MMPSFTITNNYRPHHAGLNGGYLIFVGVKIQKAVFIEEVSVSHKTEEILSQLNCWGQLFASGVKPEFNLCTYKNSTIN